MFRRAILEELISILSFLVIENAQCFVSYHCLTENLVFNTPLNLSPCAVSSTKNNIFKVKIQFCLLKKVLEEEEKLELREEDEDPFHHQTQIPQGMQAMAHTEVKS